MILSKDSEGEVKADGYHEPVLDTPRAVQN
jgi:hypothetical protein